MVLNSNDLGFWNVLKDQAGQEGFNFLADAGAYYSTTINWNAAEALPYIVNDFSSIAGYFTIKGGYDLMAYKLAYEFIITNSGTIWTENKLTNFVKIENKNHSEKSYYKLFFHSKEKGDWVVHAKHLVLAIPRRSLEILQQTCNSFFEDPRLKHNIKSVIKKPSYKILLWI
jgi:hypothetical protein